MRNARWEQSTPDSNSPTTMRSLRPRGCKTNARRFTGYKLHAATATKTPLLTAVAISPGNEHDGHHAATLVEQQPHQRRPIRVIGDTAYGNVEVREQLEQRAIGVLAPLHTTGAVNEKILHKDRFTIDLETDTATCPEGHTAPIYKLRRSKPVADGRRVARFQRGLAHCDHAALPAATAKSDSAAAKTSAKPRCANSPTPPHASTSSAPDHASNGSSD